MSTPSADYERLREDHGRAVRYHIMAIERWHKHCDAILECIRDGGSLVDVVDVVEMWLDGSDALDEEVCSLIAAARQRAHNDGSGVIS